MDALLILEDGAVFEGRSFGAQEERVDEIVFNTSMTGYQEILTDPSYKGQIVAMTYPHIGNYGLNEVDIESSKPWLSGFVAKEFCRNFSNFRGTISIEDYLIKNNITGIEGIDTRAVTRHIRIKGAMKAGIFVGEKCRGTARRALTQKVKSSPNIVGRDLAKDVTCNEPYCWDKAVGARCAVPMPRIICYDFGVKYNQLRDLTNLGCSLKIVPAKTSASDVLSENPDGVFLSNGPGDPGAVTYAIDNIRKLIGKIPIFGICLGHQLLGLALGGKTYKLKFGHHGANQPVKDLTTGKVEITTQNHGFAVDMNSLDKNEVEVTHINLNDSTVEGIRHKRLPVFSVQYHPEASPGPHDSKYLFGRFVNENINHRFRADCNRPGV